MNEILHRIKLLGDIVKKNGFTYKLVQKKDDKCIYSQHNGLGRVVAYEFFKKRLSLPHPKSEEDCKNYDFVEAFPGTEEFGKRAWTYSTLEKAMLAFESQ